jgi:hypothetical protein
MGHGAEWLQSVFWRFEVVATVLQRLFRSLHDSDTKPITAKELMMLVYMEIIHYNSQVNWKIIFVSSTSNWTVEKSPASPIEVVKKARIFYVVSKITQTDNRELPWDLCILISVDYDHTNTLVVSLSRPLVFSFNCGVELDLFLP